MICLLRQRPKHIYLQSPVNIFEGENGEIGNAREHCSLRRGDSPIYANGYAQEVVLHARALG